MPKKIKSKQGKVYLVGAGPGDIGLVTLRAAELLKTAEALVYDWLVNPALLEWAQGAEKYDVGKKMKARTHKKICQIQAKTNRLLVTLARKGKKVVRLKGGDPYIFGRGGEEAVYLKEHGVSFEMVPGVSAGYAVPGCAGIPVTDRRYASLVTFVTAHEDPAKDRSSVDWKALAKIKGTLVSFMGVKTLPQVTQALREGGLSVRTPVSVIEWGTLPWQRMIEGNLKTIAGKVKRAGIGSPAVTVIGEVNRLRKVLRPKRESQEKSLRGKTVLLTRPKSQSSFLRQALERKGAQVLELPAIQILPPKDWASLDQAIERIRDFHWVFFTSANAVPYFFERLFASGKDVRSLSALKIAAVGEITREALTEKGIRVDFMPKRFTANSLLNEFKNEYPLRGQKILLPRADIAPDLLPKELEALGAQVKEVVAYQTLSALGPKEKNLLQRWIQKGKIDYVTFASSSAVQNFFRALPPKTRSQVTSRFVTMGPVTSKTLREFGFKPFQEAKAHTAQGLVEVLTHE